MLFLVFENFHPWQKDYRAVISGARGPPQFLKKRSENAGANENLSGGFAAIPRIAPRVAPRIVGFVLIKSWEAIPRMEFRIPRMEFPIPRAAPRIPRNSPRAPRMAFSLRELESQRPATGLRTPKSPKVPGRVLGRVPGKRGLLGGLLGAVPGGRFLWKNRETALLPAVPPAVPFFPALFPALSPALLGIWAFSVL